MKKLRGAINSFLVEFISLTKRESTRTCVRVRDDIPTSSSNQSRSSVEERKLALTGQVSFVLARPYYLILIPSISQNVLPPFLFHFYLFQALRWSTDFPSFTYLLGPRAIVTILSQSLLRVQHFSGSYLASARTGQSPKC